jgi:cytochrome o ubiquinol oxidase subunit 2
VPRGDQGLPMRTVAAEICTADNPTGAPLPARTTIQ